MCLNFWKIWRWIIILVYILLQSFLEIFSFRVSWINIFILSWIFLLVEVDCRCFFLDLGSLLLLKWMEVGVSLLFYYLNLTIMWSICLFLPLGIYSLLVRIRLCVGIETNQSESLFILLSHSFYLPWWVALCHRSYLLLFVSSSTYYIHWPLLIDSYFKIQYRMCWILVSYFFDLCG